RTSAAAGSSGVCTSNVTGMRSPAARSYGTAAGSTLQPSGTAAWTSPVPSIPEPLTTTAETETVAPGSSTMRGSAVSAPTVPGDRTSTDVDDVRSARPPARENVNVAVMSTPAVTGWSGGVVTVNRAVNVSPGGSDAVRSLPVDSTVQPSGTSRRISTPCRRVSPAFSTL